MQGIFTLWSETPGLNQAVLEWRWCSDPEARIRTVRSLQRYIVSSEHGEMTARSWSRLLWWAQLLGLLLGRQQASTQWNECMCPNVHCKCTQQLLLNIDIMISFVSSFPSCNTNEESLKNNLFCLRCALMYAPCMCMVQYCIQFMLPLAARALTHLFERWLPTASPSPSLNVFTLKFFFQHRKRVFSSDYQGSPRVTWCYFLSLLKTCM